MRAGITIREGSVGSGRSQANSVKARWMPYLRVRSGSMREDSRANTTGQHRRMADARVLHRSVDLPMMPARKSRRGLRTSSACTSSLFVSIFPNSRACRAGEIFWS